MMKSAFSINEEPAVGCGVILRAVWIVEADATYDVRRSAGRNLLAIRTLAGCGHLHLIRHAEVELAPKTLIVVEDPHLLRYRCFGEAWHFWWFEFKPSGALALPLNRLMHIPAQKRDQADVREIMQELRRQGFVHRTLASAAMAALLHRWAVRWQGHCRQHPYQDRIMAVINYMHERLADDLRIADLARRTHLSERQFRNVFQALNGISPKRFLNELRLQAAMELLRLGIYQVAEVAAHVGFACPFYFSRVFHRRYGVPPSGIVRNDAGFSDTS